MTLLIILVVLVVGLLAHYLIPYLRAKYYFSDTVTYLLKVSPAFRELYTLDAEVRYCKNYFTMTFRDQDRILTFQFTAPHPVLITTSLKTYHQLSALDIDCLEKAIKWFNTRSLDTKKDVYFYSKVTK